MVFSHSQFVAETTKKIFQLGEHALEPRYKFTEFIDYHRSPWADIGVGNRGGEGSG